MNRDIQSNSSYLDNDVDGGDGGSGCSRQVDQLKNLCKVVTSIDVVRDQLWG